VLNELPFCREATLFAMEEEDEQQQHQPEGGGMPQISMVCKAFAFLEGYRMRQSTPEVLDFLCHLSNQNSHLL
jgi:hypothetical protein